MSDEKAAFVVTADWLQKASASPDLRIVDASWYLPAQKRDGADEYATGHIPGAIFSTRTRLPTRRPRCRIRSPRPILCQHAGKLGISDRHDRGL